MTENNPLRQYFRRPGVYLKLPSGGSGYPPGTIDLPENGEVPVYPMTAIDEITTRTPDALFNGTAVIEVIASCVPNIKDPWSISSVDLDPILVAIRTATHGNTMEIETTCPECEESAKYDVNLAGVLSSFKPGDYATPLPIGDITVKFKPLKFTEINQAGLAQFQIQKMLQTLLASEDDPERGEKSVEMLKEMSNLAMKLIASSIEYVKVPTATVMDYNYILDFLQNIDKNTYETIKDHSVKLRESTENKPLEVKCIHCQHEYQQSFSINATDFFG